MKKLIIILSIFTISHSFAQNAQRLVPNYKISNEFNDQFNQLDWTLFWVYSSQSTGWRETYLQPFKGFPSANAQNVWGTWYCPYVNGGISYRWQAKPAEPKTPKILDLNWDVVSKLTKDKLNLLSPCEKADVYFGNKDFRITKHEMYWRGKLRGQNETKNLISSTEAHEGFCNGARAAGALTPEPTKNITLKSLIDSAIEITFYPLDIKMLATMSYFHIDANKVAIIEAIQDGIDYKVNAACWDVALRSIIGEKMMAFFMDLDPSPGVATNVSVIGYNRVGELVNLTNEEQIKYPNALNKVKVTNKIFYLGEINLEDASSPTSNDIKNHKKFVDSVLCTYDLYLEKGTSNIIEGVWTGDNFIPDNIWFASGYGSDDVYVYSSPISQANSWDDKRQLRLGNPYLSGIFIYNLTHRSGGR